MIAQATKNYVEMRDSALSNIESLKALRNEVTENIASNEVKTQAARAEVARARKRVMPWWPPGLRDRREALSLAIDRQSELVCSLIHYEDLAAEYDVQIADCEEEHEKYRLLARGQNLEEDATGGDLLKNVTAIARSATAHNYGETVTAGQVINPNTVEVLMSSWPRAQEARRRLEAEGYSTSDGLNSFGQWIRVWKN